MPEKRIIAELAANYAEAVKAFRQYNAGVGGHKLSEYNRCTNAMIDLLRAVLDENGFPDTEIIL